MDIDEDAVAEHDEQCKACDIERTEKKFDERLVKEGKPTHGRGRAPLRSRLRAVTEEFARFEKEHVTGKAALKRDKPAEKLIVGIDKLE